MKKSIFTIAIALVAFSNISLAGNSDNNATIKFYGVEDATILNPETVLKETTKSIEDVIAANNQIIESQSTVSELSAVKKTTEQVISEDNQILESNNSNQVFALDFKRINKPEFPTKSNSVLDHP